MYLEAALDEERMQSGHWLESVLCVTFSAFTAGMVTVNPCHLSPKVLLQNNLRTKTGEDRLMQVRIEKGR